MFNGVYDASSEFILEGERRGISARRVRKSSRKVVKIRAKSEFLGGPGACCGSDGRRAKPFVITQRHSHQRLRQVPQLQHFTTANPFGSLTCHRPNLLFGFSFPSQLSRFSREVACLLNCQFFYKHFYDPLRPIMCAATSIPSPRDLSQSGCE